MTKEPTFKFHYDPAVQKQMDENPAVAESIRETNARIRQLLSSVDLDDPEAVREALSAIGPVDTFSLDSEEVPEEVRDAFAEIDKRKPT